MTTPISKTILERLNSGNDSVNKTELLSDIKSNYESIFSWEIRENTKEFKMKRTDFLRKIYQKMDLAHNYNLNFNLDLFCLDLISCFEMFSNFEHKQALCKIKDVISILRYTQMDSFFDQISDACFHVAYISQAYIMVYLNLDVKKILSNIKPKSNFNKVEKAAIYGIKSKIFLEYSPEGNDIALESIESARNFNDKEMLWINIWLKAKRRKRTFEQYPSFPFRDELEAAKKLSTHTNLEFLMSAALVYAEAAYVLNLKRSRFNFKESHVYNKLTADLLIIVFNSTKNDMKSGMKLLYHCLSCINILPVNLLSNRIINQIINKLKTHENYRIQNALGKYYLRNKEFLKARDYFKKSSSSFSSSLLLIKVECLLSSVDNFPVVQYLRLLYASCTNSKKKRCVSAQILLYYMYNEDDNIKELLYCLDTYLNDHIDIVLKKNYINKIYPLFQLKKKFNQSAFTNEIGNNIEKLKRYTSWNSTEKIILNNIVSKFDVICNSEKMDEFSNSEMSCVVCQFHKASYVLQPCGHQCTCKNCYDSLKNNNNNLCPICRSVVHYYLTCI